MIIPPVDVKQRRFDKVLGAYRLNLGDADIAALYAIANVGDEVVID